MDLEKTIQQATDSICISPKLDLFDKIAQIANSRLEMPKECLKLVKKRMMNKNPRVQLLCLEMIEYLTCVSTQPFYQEIHKHEFLHLINIWLNNSSCNEVRDKVVELIQFWAMYFEKDNDILPNFAQIYSKSRNLGIRFPEPRASQYSHLKKIEISSMAPVQSGYSANQGFGGYRGSSNAQPSFNQNQPSYNQNQPSYNQNQPPNRNIFSETSGNNLDAPNTPNWIDINSVRINNTNDSKISKVAGDLSVLDGNCNKAESVLNDPNVNPNTSQVREQVSLITSMDSKLSDLISKLSQCGEYGLSDYARQCLTRVKKVDQIYNDCLNRGGGSLDFMRPPKMETNPFGNSMNVNTTGNSQTFENKLPTSNNFDFGGFNNQGFGNNQGNQRNSRENQRNSQENSPTRVNVDLFGDNVSTPFDNNANSVNSNQQNQNNTSAQNDFAKPFGSSPFDDFSQSANNNTNQNFGNFNQKPNNNSGTSGSIWDDQSFSNQSPFNNQNTSNNTNQAPNNSNNQGFGNQNQGFNNQNQAFGNPNQTTFGNQNQGFGNQTQNTNNMPNNNRTNQIEDTNILPDIMQKKTDGFFDVQNEEKTEPIIQKNLSAEQNFDLTAQPNQQNQLKAEVFQNVTAKMNSPLEQKPQGSNYLDMLDNNGNVKMEVIIQRQQAMLNHMQQQQKNNVQNSTSNVQNQNIQPKIHNQGNANISGSIGYQTIVYDMPKTGDSQKVGMGKLDDDFVFSQFKK